MSVPNRGRDKLAVGNETGAAIYPAESADGDCVKGFPVKDKDGNIVDYKITFTELNTKSEAIASAILD